MTNSPTLTAKQAHEQWQHQKTHLIASHAINVQESFGKRVAKVGNEGLEKIDPLSRDRKVSSPILAAVGGSAIAAGTAMGSASVVLLGMIALGKSAADICIRSAYNRSVDTYQKFRSDLADANIPEDGAQAIKSAKERSLAEDGILDNAVTMTAGAATWVMAGASLAVYGLLDPSATTAAYSATLSVAAGVCAGGVFKNEAREKLWEGVKQRSNWFSNQLEARREAIRQSLGVAASGPKLPGSTPG